MGRAPPTPPSPALPPRRRPPTPPPPPPGWGGGGGPAPPGGPPAVGGDGRGPFCGALHRLPSPPVPADVYATASRRNAAVRWLSRRAGEARARRHAAFFPLTGV